MEGAACMKHDNLSSNEIRVAGVLSPDWSAWFDGVKVRLVEQPRGVR